MENSLDDIRKSIQALFDSDRYRIVRNIDLYRGMNRFARRHVLHQETLQSDLNSLYHQLGLGAAPERWPHAKQGTSSQQLNPERLFTRGQLDAVNHYFDDEFSTFGYKQI